MAQHPMLRENVPIFVTVATFMLFLLKTIIVSNGSVVTAIALINESTLAQVILGLVLVVLPTLGTLTIGIWSGWSSRWADYGRPLNELPVAALFISLILTAFLTPWIVLPIVIAIVLWNFRPLIRAARRKEHPLVTHPLASATLTTQRAVGQVAWVALGLIAIGIFVANRTMWLPPEIVETRSGPAVIGYWLSEEPVGKTVAILRESDRQIVRMRIGDIVRRSYCRVDSDRSLRASALLSLLVRDAPDYPLCEDLRPER